MTFLALLLMAALIQTPAVHIEGVVLDAATGKPIVGATVFLSILEAKTGADGKFAFDTPEAGSYEIQAGSAGYELWRIKVSQEDVRQKTNVVFRLVPHARGGVVTGRALDNAGRPIVGVQVELLQYRYFSHAALGSYSERAELWKVDRPAGGQTNDRGEYRFIDVPPGKYFLRVPSPTPLGLPFTTTPPLSPLGALFYPGVAGVSKAEQIEVRSGEELKIRDLVLSPTSLQPIRVRPASGMSLHGGPVAGEPPFTVGEVNGIRVLRPDEPGDYAVCASLILRDPAANTGHSVNACKDVTYTGAELDVQLTPTIPRGYLTGHVLLDETPPRPFADVNVGVMFLGPIGNLGATSGPDGAFKSAYPEREGQARLRFLSVPEGYYVSSVRQGSRDALSEGILHSDQDTNLDVRVVQSASVLRGRVPGADRATIVLIPQGALALRQDVENTHRVTTTNLNGSFELRNLIPGTYRAYALDKIEEGSHLDSLVFKPFEAQSTVVEITRNANVSIELRRIP